MKKEDGLFCEKGLIYRLSYGLAAAVGFFILWAMVSYSVFTRPEYEQFSGFLPIPTIKALWRLFFQTYFWSSALASLCRVFIGITISFVIGLPLGILIGFYRHLKDASYTPIQFLRMISPLSWMPIALLVFESFESAVCFLITMATVWPIILNTAHSVSQVNPHWINMARNQGAKDFQVIRYIIVPASVPYILTSVRLALGIAWIVLVPAEFLGISVGLGYIINDARDTMEYDRLMAAVIAIGIIGFILDGIIEILQKLFNNK